MGDAAGAAEDSTPKGLPASIPELLKMRRAEPDGAFLITDDERLTFGEADTASLELAEALLTSPLAAPMRWPGAVPPRWRPTIGSPGPSRRRS